MEYNTSRTGMHYREYGRNVEKMVRRACEMPENEEKDRVVELLLKMMSQAVGVTKKDEEAQRKLWDHLMIMSDFRLESYWPYEREELERLKERQTGGNQEQVTDLGFVSHKIQYRHYGKNLETMLKRLSTMEEGEEYEELVRQIACQSKSSYLTWNGDMPDDRLVFNQMFEVSKDPRIAKAMEGYTIVVNANSVVNDNIKQQGVNRKRKKKKGGGIKGQ